MQMKRIRLIDLVAQNNEIKADIEASLAEIHRNTAYVGGPAVEAFEKEFANFLGVRHVIGVSSGTDALRLALLALDVTAGDEVITTPMTFIGTAEAIVQTGARPVFVDIDPETGNMSMKALRRYLETASNGRRHRAKAVLPVDLYGLPIDCAELISIAQEYSLKIVEDACQAHGARVQMRDGTWVRSGSIGAAGCFSFYPGKNLGAWGEAGAIATNDDELAQRAMRLRDHGRISHYAHEECGYNARLDAVQAAVLSAKLKRLDGWNRRRRAIAAMYRELLDACDGLTLPVEPGYAESCYHLFVIRSERRDALRTALLAQQIECGIHYPLPLHLQPAFRGHEHAKGDFPASERMADLVLSLPMHPHLAASEVERVASVIVQELEEEKDLFAGRRYQQTACSSPPRGK
jgi:dTDP-4-amino-4,6-dideoxygalactose transaminase